MAVALLAGLVLAGAPATAPAQEPAPAPAAPPEAAKPKAVPVISRLSDERTFTRSARPVLAEAVRAAPSPDARVVGRLRTLTEEGFAETYLLLTRRDNPDGTSWVRLRLPGRPNGRTGWVPRDALGAFRMTHTALVIDRRTLRATFLVRGRPRWSARVGVGAPGSPTPAGRHWVREQFPVRPGSIYGAYAFGTSAYAAESDWQGSDVVGIHGTDRPDLIPGRPSRGCIRMTDRDVRWLARHLPDGAPILIR